MIRSIIIDDSKNAIELLSDILENYLPQVQLLGYAQDVDSGISLINELNPDLIFLDIEIHDKTGFDILKALPERDFNVIFITAYNTYAIEAFNHNAIHYILKPVVPVKLIDAVNRLGKNKSDKKLESFSIVESLETQINKKIAVCTEKETKYIKLSEIRYIRGDGRYSEIYLENNERIIVSKLLKEMENQIAIKEFYRVNKTYLVNLNYVKMIKHVDGGIIEMTDGTNILIPRRKRNDFTIRMTRFLD